MTPVGEAPGGRGQGARLPGRRPRGGGFGKLPSPSYSARSPVGPRRAGGSLGWGGGPGRHLARPGRPGGRTDARPGRGAQGRGVGGPPRRTLTWWGDRFPAGCGGRRRDPRRSAGKGRAAGLVPGREERGPGSGRNEWRLPVGAEGSPGRGVSAGAGRTGAPRSRRACGCLTTVEDSYLQSAEVMPERQLFAERLLAAHSFI